MKFPPIVMLTLLVVTTTTIVADDRVNDDEIAIYGVFERLTEAWRDGDGNAWANEFVEDADFTVWFGFILKGREQIAWGHQLIFDTFYADTVFELGIRQIRFVTPDVAIVHLNGSVVREGEARAEESDAVPMAVLRQDDSHWKIVAFQNTPNAADEMRNKSGDLRLFKKYAAEQPDVERIESESEQ
jgi:uncharacterized protein (TIGR02246 family)